MARRITFVGLSSVFGSAYMVQMTRANKFGISYSGGKKKRKRLFGEQHIDFKFIVDVLPCHGRAELRLQAALLLFDFYLPAQPKRKDH